MSNSRYILQFGWLLLFHVANSSYMGILTAVRYPPFNSHCWRSTALHIKSSVGRSLVFFLENTYTCISVYNLYLYLSPNMSKYTYGTQTYLYDALCDYLPYPHILISHTTESPWKRGSASYKL